MISKLIIYFHYFGVIFNNRFDKILGNNCYGVEKVKQIKLKYNIDEYDEILVFGDSKGDYEMSKMGKYHHKFFNLKKSKSF